MALYKNTKSRLRMKTGNLRRIWDWSGSSNGDYHLNSLLFLTVMEEITNEDQKKDLWEFLYTHYIVLTANMKEKVISVFNN